MSRLFALFVTLLLPVFAVFAAPVETYLPKNQSYDDSVIKPEDSVGFGIGERHIRHDQMLNYISALAEQSSRMQLTDIGRTYEHRRQILLTISSEQNLANLDSLLLAHHNNEASAPIVVWLGYSVHGDEISGTNAAMVVAYHLAASQSPEVKKMLEQTIIVMEPTINPDGMDRFVNWVNTYRGMTENSDPNHIEHHQGWRTGRTNHFGFDLNRDWLLLSQKESRNRLKYFHKYKPHVLGDFHEMGAHGTYFFQPGIPTRNHPLTPQSNIKMTQLLARYHAAALDKKNRLYYSEENFDDFYYGKGSTYPDINGSVGILFEQGSSRGMQQMTTNGLLTFEYGIQNQVLTSLSTLQGSWQNIDKLKQYRTNFIAESEKLAKKDEVSGYLISEDFDQQKLNYFLDKLSQHQINIYPLSENFKYKDKIYRQGSSFYVPLQQKQYRVIKALFNQQKNFQDNTFYDVSGWTMPLAMDIEFHPVARTWGLNLQAEKWQPAQASIKVLDQNAYAYLIEWHHLLAPKMLNQLLAKGVKAKVANKAFAIKSGANVKQYRPGTIMVSAAIQQNKKWREVLAKISTQTQISVDSVTTGFSESGIDLGSGSFRTIKQPKVLLIGGKGSSQYEAAEALYYLDNLQGIAVSIIEQQRLSRIDLSVYSHILMIDGSYDKISEPMVTKLERWLKQGGVILAQKRAAKWLSDKDILKVDFVSKNQMNQLFDTEGLTYQDKEKLAGRKRIAGAIYHSKLDLSHPLAYGFTEENLPLFRNSTLIMERPSEPFVTVSKYTQQPLMSGYTDENLVNRIANNAAVVAHNVGKGKVIATADNLAFRGYWLGSARLMANSLFFANAFSVPVN